MAAKPYISVAVAKPQLYPVRNVVAPHSDQILLALACPVSTPRKTLLSSCVVAPPQPSDRQGIDITQFKDLIDSFFSAGKGNSITRSRDASLFALAFEWMLWLVSQQAE